MSESIKAMLPTVTFRPSGAEHFHALLTLMVGMNVEITYVENYPSAAWDGSWKQDRWEVRSKRGEITYVTDRDIFITNTHVPKEYNPADWRIPIDHTKMIEVIG